MQRAKSVLKSLRLPSPRHLAAAQQLWSPPTHSQSFTQAPQREITGGQKQVRPEAVIKSLWRFEPVGRCAGQTIRGPKTTF